MIYVEKIRADAKDLSIERQNNSPNGKWYGVSVCAGNVLLADNEEWISKTLPTLTDKELRKEFKEEYAINFSDDDIRLIKKVVKKAKKLGWFDEIDNTVLL
jgi:hypothetical protein